jgi:hypothetical protein
MDFPCLKLITNNLIEVFRALQQGLCVYEDKDTIHSRTLKILNLQTFENLFTQYLVINYPRGKLKFNTYEECCSVLSQIFGLVSKETTFEYNDVEEAFDIYFVPLDGVLANVTWDVPFVLEDYILKINERPFELAKRDKIEDGNRYVYRFRTGFDSIRSPSFSFSL